MEHLKSVGGKFSLSKILKHPIEKTISHEAYKTAMPILREAGNELKNQGKDSLLNYIKNSSSSGTGGKFNLGNAIKSGLSKVGDVAKQAGTQY